MRSSMCFTWQSTVNGHGVGVCVGVVELPAGPGPSTDILHTGSPFLSLRSTRRPLISTSCLPSNSDYRREPLEFMIAK